MSQEDWFLDGRRDAEKFPSKQGNKVMDMNKVLEVMPLGRAMAMYAISDRERFCCSYEEAQRRRPDSTFYADFSVADAYGEDAIKDTYKRAFNEWNGNAKMFTELVAALNHKIWFWFEIGVEEYAKLYDNLWKKADKFGCDNFKGDDATHFYQVLD